MKTLFIRIVGVLKGFFSNKKRVFEAVLSILLIVLGLALYFSLSNTEQIDYKIRELNDGINAYRLEQYDKAEILLLKTVEISKQKKIKSLATLYLGNIYYRLNNFNIAFAYYRKAISLYEKNIHALYNAALCSLKKGDIDRALKYSLKAYDLDPQYSPNLLLLGNIYYGMGEYTDTISIFEEADDTDSIIKFNRACAFIRLQEPKKAEDILNEIITDHGVHGSIKGLCYVKLGELTLDPDFLRNAANFFPSSPVLKYNLALNLLPQGNYAEIAALLRTINGQMRNRDFELLFGGALFKGGYYKEALEFYMELYERNSEPEVAQIIGDIYLRLSNTELAETFYSEVLKDFYNERVFINLFTIYMDEGNNEMAINLCNEAIKMARESSLPYVCLAIAHFQLEDRMAAEEYLGKAAHYSKDNVQDLMRIAVVYQRNGLYNNALQLYHRILSIDPAHVLAQGGIAEVYLHTGHSDKAKRTLENLIYTIESEDLNYRLSLMLAQVCTEGESIKLYERLIRDFPYRYEAYLNLSRFLIESEEYVQAAQTVKLCLNRIETMDARTLSDLYSLLGVSLLWSGRMNEAIDAFHTAREHDSRNEIPLMNIKVIGDMNIKGESSYY